MLLTPGSGLIDDLDAHARIIDARLQVRDEFVDIHPGRTRQSSVASLVEGMTFTCTGDPTPAVSVVSEIVLRWMAAVFCSGKLASNGPPHLFDNWMERAVWRQRRRFADGLEKITLALSGIGCEPWPAVPGTQAKPDQDLVTD